MGPTCNSVVIVYLTIIYEMRTLAQNGIIFLVSLWCKKKKKKKKKKPTEVLICICKAFALREYEAATS